MRIEELDLSARAYNTLKRAHIDTVEQLKRMSKDDLLKLRNMGVGTAAEIQEKLEQIPDSDCFKAMGLLQRYLERGTDCYTTEFVNAIKLAIDALELKHKFMANTGEVSDGHHTFNELYHHRAVLFSVICRLYCARAWKSKLHDDGTMYDGMFIVGVETPWGQATYHYDVAPYWNMFDVPELERAPVWDGHTSDEAIIRISQLGRWEDPV